MESGVYPHIAGDGREYVVTDETAVKVRAEDGRSIRNVDISMFIGQLPNGKDTKSFYTEDASGSTSQAANVMESIEAGSKTLLMDEDTSATNFMVRDELMQRVIHREMEPITPFIERVRMLYEKYKISTVLVAGSSGAYFEVADTIIQMDCYVPREITELAKEEAKGYPRLQLPEDTPVLPAFDRKVKPSAGLRQKGRVKLKTMGRDGVMLNHETIDLRYVEQLADAEQLTMLGQITRYLEEDCLLYTSKGIICLESSIAWGFYTLGLFFFLQNMVSSLVDALPVLVGKVGGTMILVIYLFDFLHTMYQEKKYRGAPMKE